MLIVEPESYRRQRHVLELSRDKTLDVVCAVAGKREALSYLVQRPVDFIVTNSMLPDGSPADIIRAAHKRNPDCLVLAASGCDDANIVMHTITSGRQRLRSFFRYDGQSVLLPACFASGRLSGQSACGPHGFALAAKSGKSASPHARRTPPLGSRTRHPEAACQRHFFFPDRPHSGSVEIHGEYACQKHLSKARCPLPQPGRLPRSADETSLRLAKMIEPREMPADD